MNNPVTLLEFLESTGARLRIYDMGRRVVKIPREEFLAFEQTRKPWPYPMQQQAWFGMSMLDRSLGDEPLIWFLRFPLDEQGKLLQAGRDYFIHRLLEAAAAKQHPEKEDTADLQDALKDNPHTFKPRQDRLAVFHAKLSRDLKRPPSRFHAPAREYFSGATDWAGWEQLGYQGIADLAARLAEDGIEARLAAAIPHLPDQPLEVLCHCLENEPLPAALSAALLEQLQRELASDSAEPLRVATLLRGLSLGVSRNHRESALQALFAHPVSAHIEVLAAIAGRQWESLREAASARRYLEKLADSGAGQEGFNQCLADLLALPGLRDPLLGAIRDPARSDQLAARFAAMTGSLGQ